MSVDLHDPPQARAPSPAAGTSPVRRLLRAVSRTSRLLHRWIGLGLVVYLGWMGASGVLLNHPRLTREISVPEWMVPPEYRISNWSRGTLRSLATVPGTPGTLIAAGRLGVWISDDEGRSFTGFHRGLGSLFARNARQVVALAGAGGPLFLVTTQSGLYARSDGDDRWRKVPLGGERPGSGRPGSGRPAIKVVQVEDRLLAFTDSGVYVSPAPPRPLEFVPAALERQQASREVPLADALFDLHSGEAWGLPGRLAYDVVGIVLVVLSFSALLTWLYSKVPRRARRARPRIRALVRVVVRYHLKLGIWVAPILLLIGLSGMFMRPPLLVLVADALLPRWIYPGVIPANPWHHKIQNATYDAAQGRLLVQANDGIWAGSPDLKGVFRRVTLPVPVFAMGATVFESGQEGTLEVGSFSGLFRINADGSTVDLLNGGPAKSRSQMRPGEYLVTGFLRLPGGESLVSTHYQGLMDLEGSRAHGRLPMPAVEVLGAGMPLWNFLFELHNGRIFRDWIGAWYVAIVPFGGLCLVLLTVTGVWDWVVPRWRRWRAARG